MSTPCYLAVDLGAASGRVIAGVVEDGHVRLEELHRFPNGAVNVAGTLRWNVLSLWSEIQAGLAKAAEQFRDDVVSVGVDTWGVDYVLLGQQDELLGFPYHYRDSRTDHIIEFAVNHVPRHKIFAQTGLQFLPFNTLFQLIAMRRASPGLLDSAQRLLMMPDFFHWLLSGSQVMEFTNATTTQCLDPHSGNWAEGLLRKFDIPTHIFPEIVSTGTKLGSLRGEVAQQTGLGRIEVVAPATHDTGAAVTAVPTLHTGAPNWAYISSGTWSLMGVEVSQAIVNDRALELNVTNEGGIDGTYRLLKNIAGLWAVQECQRSFAKRGKSFDFDELQNLARDAKPFRCLIDPDDSSFLAPDDMPTAIVAWCDGSGQAAPQTEGEFIRASLESLALKYRMVLSWLEELTGVTTEVIHIVGGGTKNELLCQFTADACRRPVVAGPVEATALGNVLVQARTAGSAGSLSDIREIVARSFELKHYQPANTADWDAAYRRYHDLLSVPRR